MKVRVVVSENNKINVQIVASNGEQLARSKAQYHSSKWAEVMELATADILNSTPTVEKAANDEYTWSGEFFMCSETYKNKSHAEKMIKKIYNMQSVAGSNRRK